MVLTKEKDWKDALREDAKKVLENIFESVQQHRAAYTSAKNVANAQQWCAIIELQKEINELREMLKKLEEPFKAIISLADIEKRKTIEKFVTEIIKPAEGTKEEEISKKLVDSLMKL
jgi:predicted mannosyl-3-phosphoglycerate phosphatase (HAD superfamily)